MRTARGAVRAFRLSGGESREVLEDLVGSLEPLPVLGDELRDFVFSIAILLPRRDLLRDEIDAELGQPPADGGRERAPLGLVERQHVANLDAVRTR